MTPRTFTAGAAVAALLVTTGAATAAPTHEEQVLTLTNRERATVGCQALAPNARLGAAAKRHNGEMARTGGFDHVGADGSTPEQRVTDAGYAYRVMAENIATGQATAGEVVRDWMGSEGHRANILDCRLRDLGVAFTSNSGGRTYWTQVFGVTR